MQKNNYYENFVRNMISLSGKTKTHAMRAFLMRHESKRAFVQRPHYLLLILLCLSTAGWSQIDGDDSAEILGINDTIEMTEQFKQHKQAYQDCITAVMSRLESATVKRLRIEAECQAAQDVLVASYPAEGQRFVQTQMQRNLEVILSALENAEIAVEQTVDDTADIMDIVEPDVNELFPSGDGFQQGYADDAPTKDTQTNLALPSEEDLL